MFIRILGDVVVEADGPPVALSPKVRTLLALLAAAAPHVVPTDQLVDSLYGDTPPDGESNALQAQVSRLRKVLGSAAVERTPIGYRLTLDPQLVDAHRFAALAKSQPAEALALWRGSPPEVLGSAYLSRLEELRLTVLEADIAADLGPASVPRLRELIGSYPLREQFRALLMRALAASGRQAEALEAYEDARRTLADELGTDPSPELVDAHVAILRAEPLRASPVPAQLTTFVGRDADLAAVLSLLDRHRLVTLTGPGGAGKTRLAVEVAHRITSPIDQTSVCFVEFAATEDVPQAVLDALSLREQRTGQPTPPVDRLVAALADRPMVLVFDNCEHVVDAAAHLASALLARCPLLKVLATSREPLDITGEALYPVPRLTEDPAVQLFVDRATAVRADLPIDQRTVRRICAALDGLPLAIELAAARVRTLGLDAIAARLDDRFSLLSKGSRTADARHRTLRAVVEWSWDLLSPEEQALAARLSVFTGFTFEAAGDELVTSLVDKSLVEVAGDRYRMLTTIREFCASKLTDRDQACRDHATYFLDLARSADLMGADQLTWLNRLEADHDNLHSALRWAVGADTELALRLVSAMSSYWWMRGRRREGAQLCLDLALRLGPSAPPGFEEEYVLCVINAIAAEGEEPLRAHLRTAYTWGQERDHQPSFPFVTAIVGPALGPPPPGKGELIVGDDPWSQALAPLGESYLRTFAGRVHDAQDFLVTALDRFEAVGERWGMIQCLNELAVIVSYKGEHARAIDMLNRGTVMVQELGSIDELCEMITRRGDCHLRSGDVPAAVADYLAVEDLAQRLATPGLLIGARVGLATVARRRGDLAEARRLCEQALAECGSGWFGPDWARWQILVAFGWLSLAQGDPAAAADWLRQAMDGAVKLGNGPQQAAATEGMAGLALLEGDPRQAAWLLGRAVGMRGISVAGDVDVADVAARTTDLLGAADFAEAYREGLTSR
ncbi:BTAD domain-containing putative transcriptional regulator [Kibdelosporangium lantanae]